MFWGKGDTSKLDDAAQETLAHLRRMEETGHIMALNHEQSQVAIRALTFYTRFEGTLQLVLGLKNVALLVGALLAIYWASEGWIVQKIREIVAP